ncbi:MAG TPA: hypothetical protein PKM88_05945 [bacterium]|nr:hypothetical protein [bacterium]
MNEMMKELIASVHRLSLSAEGQLASLPDGCCKADELALDFNDAWRVVVADVPPEAEPMITELDQLLESMSGQDKNELWTDTALKTKPEWALIREKAKRILEIIQTAP